MNYFTSDLHFGHHRIIEFERDRFKTIEEHDDFIMSKIEQRVKAGDTLYNLGDFGFGSLSDDIIERYRKLPCKKVLICGNHDTYNKIVNLGVFDEVYKNPIFLTRRILLSHEPEMCSPYVLNIHGHLHASYLNSDNHVNANIYMQNYNLLSEKAVNKKLGKLPEFNNGFGAEWYYSKYVFTKEHNDKVLNEDGSINVEETLKYWENFFEEMELADGTKKELKKVAGRELNTLFKDRNDNFYIGVWDSENKKNVITPTDIEIVSADNKGYVANCERWEKYYVNGKKWGKMFPRAKNEERYLYIKKED